MSDATYGIVLIVCAAATWWMTGLVWFCAIVHYPLFSAVGDERFRAYHAEHVRRTGQIVLVPMMLELASSLAIAVFPPPAAQGSALPMLGAGLVVAIWLCTFFRQVPDHDRLSAGFDTTAHTRLLRGNHLRSVLWLGHAVIVGMQCYCAIMPD